MEERLRFVVRLLEGEAMSDLAREFGISRKTGYKTFNRYKASNQSTTRSPQGCQPCLRYALSPMCPGRTAKSWCRRRELNPRPTHYECVALPLSYCGIACPGPNGPTTSLIRPSRG